MTEDISKVSWPGWETVGLIGRGSFGAVYEIQRKIPGNLEKAALKVISIPQYASDLEVLYSDGYDEESITSTFQSHLESIIAEYTLTKKMSDCINVVNSEDVRYVQHDDGIGWDIFIKMELLTPLTKTLPKNIAEEIPEETVIRLAKDICNALNACSEYNIVHRDIKPQNIFVSEHGDYKLGDFGIAKTVEKTMGGTKIGTYRFMAPEVYNNQPYGIGADIYSLGLVLYWMLNERRLPFLPLPPTGVKPGMDETARNRRFSGEPFPPPAHGSDNLKRIVLKACAYDPADRYRSAADMLLDLNALGSKKRVKLAGIVGSVPPALVPGDMLPDNMPPNDMPPIPVPDDVLPRKKTRWPSVAGAAAIGIALIAGGLFYYNGAFGSSSSSSDTSNKFPQETSEWSEWMDELPLSISESDGYEIEEGTLYRSREKETTTSSDAVMDGWEQYDTSVSTGEYGAWSNWSTTPVSASDTRKVEEAVQYRYRDLQTTTSSSNTLAGWTLSNQTSAWGSYGPWSDWQTSTVSSSDSRQVETKTQYSYRTKTVSQEYTDWGSWSSWQDASVSGNDTKDVQTRTVYLYYWYQCPNCGAHMHGYGFICPTWANGCGQAMISDQYHVIWGTIPQSQMGFQDWHGTGHTYAYYEGNLVFRNIYNPNESKTQYRYRTRSLKDVVSYSDWSSYSDTPVSNTSTREVRTRTVYRYRDRVLQHTYYFSKWGNWSSWSTNPVSETSTRQVGIQKVYRHADKGQSTVYHFWRWGEWSDFSEEEVIRTENVDVEEKAVYRYREK